MHIEANVFVGKFLRTLFANANIDDREEVRLSVCRLLQALGLVKIEVTIERSEAIRLACFPTEELEHILRDNDDNNNNNKITTTTIATTTTTITTTTTTTTTTTMKDVRPKAVGAHHSTRKYKSPAIYGRNGAQQAPCLFHLSRQSSKIRAKSAAFP